MTTKLRNLLVITPHAGIKKPIEIPASWLSADIDQTIKDVTDWHTDLLYDFKKILGNKQLGFPINQAFINPCRHPDFLDDSVPLNINGRLIYKDGPTVKLRKQLLKKYFVSFHKKIGVTKKSIILEGHSFIKGTLDNKGKKIEDDITLSDYTNSKFDPRGGIRTAPDGYIDYYANQLRERLPGLSIGKNSVYTSVYDHILSSYSWDGKHKKGKRVPIIHQETNEKLYLKGNKLNMNVLLKLRRAFAESLQMTINYFENQRVNQ